MSQAYRVGDLCTGHDSHDPTGAVEGSTTVFANGLGLVREGDQIEPHGCYNNDPAKRVLASGSSTVFVNGRPAARSGDPISCGGFADAGSDDVNIGK
ncbi:PAAR domain-containing protein [Ruegeria jejuensis]|uniref:PAAR domain-containing protein n=1 Tax=Ruegeria jejuensis TaxID=3233338 RepID=UPI00355B13B7